MEDEHDGLYLSLRDVSHEVRLQKLRSHYLTVVSHELRTPLTALENLLTLLLPDRGEEMSRGQRKIVEGARHQILRLAHQVDKLLLLASLERDGGAQPASSEEHFDVHDVVREAASACRFQAEEQCTHFDLTLDDAPLLVRGDREDARKAVYELMENAVKFTPPDGQVSVRVEEEPDRIAVVVCDSGIGIDHKFHRAIFDEFRQLEEPVTRTYGGAGLGLALARRIVARWGGEIDVTSEVGSGSEFRLWLPSATAVPEGESPRVATVRCGGSEHE